VELLYYITGPAVVLVMCAFADTYVLLLVLLLLLVRVLLLVRLLMPPRLQVRGRHDERGRTRQRGGEPALWTAVQCHVSRPQRSSH